jgi:ribosomal protein S18 acetylase RimI-like enzyme
LSTDSRRRLELNEAGWWSNWAKIRWYGDDCYALFSEEFREPFFNRACFLSCESATVHVAELEAEFLGRGLGPHLTVGEECVSALASLRAASYRTTDRMSVMRLTAPSLSRGESVSVVPASSTERGEWGRIYLDSFYGERSQAEAVAGVLRSLPPKQTTLLLAKVGGSGAGVLACYATEGLLGVYCVGTLPEFRRRGVGGSLLAEAAKMAKSQGRQLILQTLESDAAKGFYRGQGFEEAYGKRLMTKQARGQG